MGQEGKRRLKIDLAELAEAFEYNDFGVRCYLDKVSGDILRVTDEANRVVEDIHEALGDDALPARIRAYLAGRTDIPDWQIDEILSAYRVEEAYGLDVVEILQVETWEAYRDMADFVDTVAQPNLRDRLADAIEGRGAFSRFKQTLASDMNERERWFAFKDERMRQRVLDWLDSEGIELEQD
jgi:hypothetical protein